MSDNEITLVEPRPYQVVQRYGYEPNNAGANYPGDPRLGCGTVKISGHMPAPGLGRWEARTVLLDHAFGRAVDWTPLHMSWEDQTFSTHLEVPAGGWYRLELRYFDNNEIVRSACVEPVGAGEVFLIAGQSYAENCNDEYLNIEDSEGRVAVYDLLLQEWRIAHDPQPNVIARDDRGGRFKGSIWPAAMDLLLPLIGVPIGMVNVAVGSTAIRQWMPGEKLFDNLSEAGIGVHDFRCILWQQGESDIIEKTSTDDYISRLLQIKAALEQQWGFSRCWLPAKSTLHPTVYDEPEREGKLRGAIDELWRMPGFMPGPDTDILGGIGLHRANREGSGHFTLLGQKRAGLLWCIAIWNLLHSQGTK